MYVSGTHLQRPGRWRLRIGPKKRGLVPAVTAGEENDCPDTEDRECRKGQPGLRVVVAAAATGGADAALEEVGAGLSAVTAASVPGVVAVTPSGGTTWTR